MEPNNWMLVIQRKNGEIYKPVCGISAEDILSNYVKTPEYFTSVLSGYVEKTMTAQTS